MKLFKEILGYALGAVLFVGLMPFLMWLSCGRPALWPALPIRVAVAIILMLIGLSLSVWSIVYMRHKGDGNPMDAFGHELAPRTRHLMTDGPYRLILAPNTTTIAVEQVVSSPSGQNNSVSHVTFCKLFGSNRTK